jgi:Protein of unknown function (DUF4235)
VSTRRGPGSIGRQRLWKVFSTVTALLGAMLAKRLMRAAYRAIRKEAAPAEPFDPTDARFSWPDALVWAGAAGIGLGIARVLSARIAAIGWEVATGTAPPTAVEEQAIV